MHELSDGAYTDRKLVQTVKTVTPPKFNGDMDEAVIWLLSFKEVSDTNLWTDDMRVRQVPQALTQGAKSWFRTTWKGQPFTWSEFEDRFKQTFLRQNISDHLRMKLENLKQGPSQDLLSYYFSALELCSLADSSMPEYVIINKIIDGMKFGPRRAIRLTHPRTILEVQQAVKDYTADEETTDKKEDKNNSRGRRNNTSSPATTNDKAETKPRGVCWNCDEKGHLSSACPKPKKEPAGTKSKPLTPTARNAKVRALQGEDLEHIDEDESPSEADDEEEEEIENTVNLFSLRDPPEGIDLPENCFFCSVTASKASKTPRITCKVNGQLEEAIMDTGATVTVIPVELAKTTNTEVFRWPGKPVGLANGHRLKPVGFCRATIDYRGRTHTVSAAVLKEAPDVLIGCDFQRQTHIVISYADNLITYHDEFVKSVSEHQARVAPKTTNTAVQTVQGTHIDNKVSSLQIDPQDENLLNIEYLDSYSNETQKVDIRTPMTSLNVRAKDDIVLPPQTRARIRVTTSDADELMPYFVESIKNNIQVIPGISRRKSTVIDVINISRVATHIQRRETIAKATPIDGEETDAPAPVPIPPNLTSKQREDLTQLLVKYEDVFVTENSAIGIVPFIRHEIDTGDHDPIRSKPYRVSVAEQKVIRGLVDEMLEANIIRPSRSYWASPVVLVKKKGTSELRFCVDYRKLNKITRVDPYPIPNMEAVLETLSGNHFFSKLDVKAMYWQVHMDEQSREKTAFVVHCGQYEFNVMPFGLVSAPMTAMRVMNSITRAMEDSCFVFYDDILVFAPTFESHLIALDKLMIRLREANIKLNAKKCDLLLQSVHYLGHVVTPFGIEPDQTKIEAIQAFKTPKSITETKSFMGMCNFFRRYIKGYASIARPINDRILKTNQPFKWTDEAEQAMVELKNKLMSPPILVHYDQMADLTIRCDASGFGLGGVLMQKAEDKAKCGVIAYTSRSLSKSEKNYATTHKECLAVVHAVKQWRHYLYGHPFEIVTDHHALCWLMRSKDVTNQLMRWSLILQEYTFTIKYESGKLHTDADCLSRNPLDIEAPEGESDIPTWPIHAVQMSKSTRKSRFIEELAVPIYDVAAEQAADEYCKAIIEALKSPQATNQTKKLNHFTLKDSILYRRSKSNKKRFALVLPKSMVNYVLIEAHDKPLGGHFGLKRTLDAIKMRFYWPTLDPDVQRYVKSCDSCQRRKTGPTKKQGIMIPMPIPRQPFEIVGMDLMGPLPISGNGNQYVLVITDYLTKFVITHAMRTTTSNKIMEVLRKNLFYLHGIPKIIITDNGTNLTSRDIEQLFQILGIEHKTTSPYRPQTNGQTERYNRVLGTQLAIFAENKKKLWCRYLAAITFAYNTTTHASHQTTPFYLVYGREPILPVDKATKRPLEVQTEDNDELTELQIIEEARKKAKHLIQMSQEKSKKRFDANRELPIYKVADLVLLHKPLKTSMKKGKLEMPWKGPFVITKRINDLNYQLRSIDDPDNEFIVHLNQIKQYTPRRSDLGGEADPIVTNHNNVQICALKIVTGRCPSTEFAEMHGQSHKLCKCTAEVTTNLSELNPTKFSTRAAPTHSPQSISTSTINIYININSHINIIISVFNFLLYQQVLVNITTYIQSLDLKEVNINHFQIPKLLAYIHSHYPNITSHIRSSSQLLPTITVNTKDTKMASPTEKCPLCHLMIDNFENHNCLRTMGQKLNRYRQEISQIQAQLGHYPEKEIHVVIDNLADRIENMEISTQSERSAIANLQEQINELRDSLEKKSQERRDALEVALQHARKAAGATQTSEPEEGEIVEDESMSGNSQSPQKLAPATSAMSLIEEEAPELGTSGQPQVDKPAQATRTVRTVVRETGPRVMMGVSGIYATPSRYVIKTTQVPIESSDSQEDTSFAVTSNNINTQGRSPGPNIELIIEHQNETPRSLWVPKDITGRNLHIRVKQTLGIDLAKKINIIHLQHKTIEADSDRSLYSIGFRHIPHHIAVVPEEYQRGDQVLLNYKGKGPNVNGGYLNFRERHPDYE